jgi:3-isopropylmalate/(R)-2-methylmalate dehydratase large subunit
VEQALEYMGLKPGMAMTEIKPETIFIGSCTNARLEDLRRIAKIIKGRKKASSVRVMVVPGSMRVRKEAEKEGIDKVFTDFGAEWRYAGCSMCLGMNPDQLKPGERSASTSNRILKDARAKADAHIWSARKWPPQPPSKDILWISARGNRIWKH